MGSKEGSGPYMQINTCAAKYLSWSFFKKSRHLGFGVFIYIWCMVPEMLAVCARSSSAVCPAESGTPLLHPPRVCQPVCDTRTLLAAGGGGGGGSQTINRLFVIFRPSYRGGYHENKVFD